MKELDILEPGGYVKIRIRDLMARAVVVAFFALAVFADHIWQATVERTSQILSAIPIKLAKQRK